MTKTPNIDATVIDCKDRSQWLAERTKSVGGSESHELIMGSPMKVYAAKVQPELVSYSTERQQWGLDLEVPVCNAYKRRYGGEVTPWPQTALARSNVNPLLHCTPDAIVYDPERDDRGVMQIKTWSAFDKAAWQDGPPLWVQVQVSHEMFVTGAAWGVVTVLFGTWELQRFYVERNDRFLEALVRAVEDFWVYVANRTPPPVDGTEATTEALKRLHPDDDGSAVCLPHWGDKAYRKLKRLQDAESRIKAAKGELENQFRAAIGDATFGVTLDGQWASWKSQNRKAYSVPESTYRVLRLHDKPPKGVELPAVPDDPEYRVARRKKLPRHWKVQLLQEDPHCIWCGCTLTERTATWEHKVPLSMGGTNDRSNLALACKPCNNERGDNAVLTLEEK